MRKNPGPARALAAALLAAAAAAGCTSVTDVDRFRAPLEDPNNPTRSLRFTVRGMDSHVSKYFELRLVDRNNWVQFVAISEPFEREPFATFNVPNVIPKRDADSYRLDFFGDMNDDRTFNVEQPRDEAGEVTADRDHSWRIEGLGETRAPELRLRGDLVDIVYVHNQQFEDLNLPAPPEFNGGDAVVELTNLGDFQNKRVEVRVTTVNRDKSVPARTLGLYRFPRLLAPRATAKMPGIIREGGETFRVTVYVDDNGNDEYDNPAEGDGDLGWAFEATPQANLQLDATFDPSNAGRSNVDVGAP